MDLGSLKPAKGAVKNRKRVGRGQGSGHGGTATRGHKGQYSRSGAKHRAWFEGGQMPVQRRLPKFGFTNLFRKAYQPVNVGRIDELVKKHGYKEITPEILKKHGLIRKVKGLVKVLGDGEFSAKVEIHAHSFSQSAKEKIEKAGGKIVQL
jgi:large subunit ribosomal protein L15